jgi:hypothetical protein
LAYIIECLSSKCEALNSNASTAEKPQTNQKMINNALDTEERCEKKGQRRTEDDFWIFVLCNGKDCHVTHRILGLGRENMSSVLKVLSFRDL